MKNKTMAIITAAVLTVGTIGGVAFATNTNDTEKDTQTKVEIFTEQNSSDFYQDMTKIMNDNDFEELSEYMRTGNIDGMNKFMDNFSEEDYQKMIKIMNENGYEYMGKMMESIGREGMQQMHNSMSGMMGSGSGYNMMGNFRSRN